MELMQNKLFKCEKNIKCLIAVEFFFFLNFDIQINQYKVCVNVTPLLFYYFSICFIIPFFFDSPTVCAIT